MKKSLLDKLEKDRKIILLLYITSALVIFIPIVTMTIFAFYESLTHIGSLLYNLIPVFAISTGVIFYFGHKKHTNLTSILKNEFIEDEIKQHFNLKKHYEYGKFDKHILSMENILEPHNTSDVSDTIILEHNNIEFTHSDAILSDVKKTKDGTSQSIYFRGRIITSNLKKTVKSPIYIRETSYPSTYLGFKSVNKATFESIDFNKSYHVHCSDNILAFKTLTPNFMELLSNFSDNINGAVLIALVGTVFYLLIYDKMNSFEPKLHRPVYTYHKMIKQQINLIKDILDSVSSLELFNNEELNEMQLDNK